MRPHSAAEATAVLDIIHDWQGVFMKTLGRRLVFAADEYYLLAGQPFPGADAYEGFPMHENGVGMARAFELEWHGVASSAAAPRAGFFKAVDGAPAEGYRAPRAAADHSTPAGAGSAARTGGEGSAEPAERMPVGVLTGTYGARILAPLVASLGRPDVRLVPVRNEFFGGNTAVAGLMVGEDVARTLHAQPAGHRYLLPDVCLTGGRFLDGMSPADLPRQVEVVPTEGMALRRALQPSPVTTDG